MKRFPQQRPQCHHQIRLRQPLKTVKTILQTIFGIIASVILSLLSRTTFPTSMSTMSIKSARFAPFPSPESFHTDLPPIPPPNFSNSSIQISAVLFLPRSARTNTSSPSRTTIHATHGSSVSLIKQQDVSLEYFRNGLPWPKIKQNKWYKPSELTEEANIRTIYSVPSSSLMESAIRKHRRIRHNRTVFENDTNNLSTPWSDPSYIKPTCLTPGGVKPFTMLSTSKIVFHIRRSNTIHLSNV